MTPIRAAAALVALASAAAIYGVSSSSAFAYARVRIDPPTRFTDPVAVETALEAARGTNLFSLDTTPLEAALGALPTVASARVTVELPGTLVATIHEREPILVWRVGDRRYLTDGDGRLFAPLGDAAPADAGALPVVDDQRASSAADTTGTILDPVDLDAATRLGSLVPADVGSTATRLLISVTDENGFVVRPVPAGWTAIFGFYTSSLRTPALVPGQVRLLRSLLTERGEATVDRVILASETDGTVTSKATPRPSPTPRPTARPTPRATPTPGPTPTPTARSTPSPSPSPTP